MQNDNVRCPECGESFSDRKYLEEHFNVKHPGEELEKPDAHGRLELPKFEKNFRNGVLVGVVMTLAVVVSVQSYQMYSYNPVDITVVTCDNCSYDRFKGVTEQYFDVRYSEVDYNSSRGQKLIKKYRINYVPGFIFDKEIEKRANYTRVRNALVEFEDAYVMSDVRNRAAQRFSRGISLN